MEDDDEDYVPSDEQADEDMDEDALDDDMEEDYDDETAFLTAGRVQRRGTDNGGMLSPFSARFMSVQPSEKLPSCSAWPYPCTGYHRGR